MAEFFLGQIMMTGFGFPQTGFAQCNGQLMPLSQYQALFALLGTQFGGNGVNNFQLPDLRGRAPAGAGPSVDASWNPPPYTMGQTDGQENVILSVGQLPQHGHMFQGSTKAAGNNTLDASLWGQTSGSPAEAIYTPLGTGALAPLDPTTLDSFGQGQAHANMQPFLTINFNIALTGIFPSRN